MPGFSLALITQLERHEGFYSRPYLCPAGKATIGFGTNLEAHPSHIEDDTIHRRVQSGLFGGAPLVDALLRAGMEWDVALARTAMVDEVSDCHAKLVRRCPAYAKLRQREDAASAARADVLLNMAFNIGVAGLLGFKKMLAAVEWGEYVTAEAEMRNSAWYKQVKTRAVELCKQMRTGAYAHRR